MRHAPSDYGNSVDCGSAAMFDVVPEYLMRELRQTLYTSVHIELPVESVIPQIAPVGLLARVLPSRKYGHVVVGIYAAI